MFHGGVLALSDCICGTVAVVTRHHQNPEKTMSGEQESRPRRNVSRSMVVDECDGRAEQQVASEGERQGLLDAVTGQNVDFDFREEVRVGRAGKDSRILQYVLVCASSECLCVQGSSVHRFVAGRETSRQTVLVSGLPLFFPLGPGVCDMHRAPEISDHRRNCLDCCVGHWNLNPCCCCPDSVSLCLLQST